MDGPRDLLWALPLLVIGVAFIWMRRRRARRWQPGPAGVRDVDDDRPVRPDELRRARLLFLLTFIALLVVIAVSALSHLQ